MLALFGVGRCESQVGLVHERCREEDSESKKQERKLLSFVAMTHLSHDNDIAVVRRTPNIHLEMAHLSLTFPKAKQASALPQALQDELDARTHFPCYRSR